MKRASETQQNRSRSPKQSIFQRVPKEIMVPRLMVILSAAALLAIGLVMVYSASSIFALVEQGNAFEEGIKQLMFASAGVFAEFTEGTITAQQAIVRFCGMVLVPLVFLFFTQSDLGTTVICFIAILAVLWLGGFDIRVTIGICVVLVVFGIMAIVQTA